jgi:hypothetical protein
MALRDRASIIGGKIVDPTVRVLLPARSEPLGRALTTAFYLVILWFFWRAQSDPANSLARAVFYGITPVMVILAALSNGFLRESIELSDRGMRVRVGGSFLQNRQIKWSEVTSIRLHNGRGTFRDITFFGPGLGRTGYGVESWRKNFWDLIDYSGSQARLHSTPWRMALLCPEVVFFTRRKDGQEMVHPNPFRSLDRSDAA